MDLLSETLLSLKIKNMLIGTYNLSQPWGFSSEGFSYGYSFNVMDNSCWLTPEGENPIELQAGDSFIFPRGGLMTLSSGTEATISSLAEVWNTTERRFTGFDSHPPGAYYETTWGGGGAGTRLLSLIFEIEDLSKSALFEALPPFIILRKHECQEFHLIRSALYAIALEGNNTQPGEFAIKSHISEALLISQLRAHVTQTHYSSGMLAATKDPYLHRALVALHREPHSQWTVKSMADQAGLSRTAFAKRFRSTLHDTPMHYLHQYRMKLAASMLKDTQLNIAVITKKLGYSTDHIFRRHFHQTYKMSPNQFRKTRT